MQNFSLFSLCLNRKSEKNDCESNANANEFFRSFSRTNLCFTQQDLYKYSQQCQDYVCSNCMCCNRKVTPEKVMQSKEFNNGTPVIPINLSPEVYVFHASLYGVYPINDFMHQTFPLYSREFV